MLLMSSIYELLKDNAQYVEELLNDVKEIRIITITRSGEREALEQRFKLHPPVTPGTEMIPC